MTAERAMKEYLRLTYRLVGVASYESCIDLEDEEGSQMKRDAAEAVALAEAYLWPPDRPGEES